MRVVALRRDSTCAVIPVGGTMAEGEERPTRLLLVTSWTGCVGQARTPKEGSPSGATEENQATTVGK